MLACLFDYGLVCVFGYLFILGCGCLLVDFVLFVRGFVYFGLMFYLLFSLLVELIVYFLFGVVGCLLTLRDLDSV